MFPAHTHSQNTAKARVTVTDLLGVQRVLTMLTGRNYSVTHFDAEEMGEGRWRITLDLRADAHQVDLLEARLHRLPSVLVVDVTVPAALAATG
jgi:acetolactate synthase regulatory subunit